MRKSLSATYVGEPLLVFAGDRLHVDQKTGIARYGPASLGQSQHPGEIRLGFVGSGASTESAVSWFGEAVKGVTGNFQSGLPDFPGFDSNRGFFSDLIADTSLTESITQHDLTGLKNIRRRAPRFQVAVELISEKVKLMSQQDVRPDIIILALPDELVEMAGQVEFWDENLGRVFHDLRRSLKADLMRYGIPTQIFLQRVSEAKPGARNVDHRSRVAWNLFTGLFFKAGGVPWRPHGLRPDTCYVGVSFHRPLGSKNKTLRTSVAQAFDEYGVGLILRGPDFHWDRGRDGPSPHLDAERSADLMDLVLRRYRQETRRTPARVVVHKTSRYWPEEREGFQKALASVDEFDLVAVSATTQIRLVRAGQYPPLRGTLFSLGDLRYLYTTGYIPALEAYPHGHVPASIEIADHVGDSPTELIAKEILILSKMNWNSSNFACALPITIRFSRLVGDIMREIPHEREPMPQFKFYT